MCALLERAKRCDDAMKYIARTVVWLRSGSGWKLLVMRTVPVVDDCSGCGWVPLAIDDLRDHVAVVHEIDCSRAQRSCR